MEALDTAKIRQDFPVLQRMINGKRLVYLDNAATSQKPKQVIDAISNYYSNYNANIHRGIHTLSEEATEAFEAVRPKLASFIGAADAREIIFTRNATEAINLVAQSWGRQNIKEGDEIILSPMEHHSNLVPWQMLAKEKNARLVFLKLTEDGLLDIESLKEALNPKSKIIAVTQMSNVLGSIVPLEEVCALAKSNGTLVLVDGAQGVPHIAIDVKKTGMDFLVFSMHKMCGPTGVGVLWGKAELLEAMPPVMGGGDMISMVWRDRYTPNQIPWKFEAGTPNIADVIASGVAIDYLNSIGMDRIRAHEIELTDYALKRFSELKDVTVYGPKDPALKGGVISFNLKGLHPHDVGQVVNEDAVAIRVGHHCCQPLMRDLDLMGTARASFYIYTEKSEIDLLIDSLINVQKVLGHVAL
ncbi:MAG: cysteine desulfurase [Candidatus Obscuribacterales bacterium]|nr:cysteine desulfurase [Candidatus Obscuribacterales bacterium]